MRALHLMVKSLAYIVKQTCALCGFDVCAELCRHKTCDVWNLKRMVKYVLTVARAVFKLAELTDKFGMNTVNACVNSGSFTRLLNGMFNLFAWFLIEFFDSCRVNSAICNEFFKRLTRYLTANGVKARNRNSLGRIVNNEVNACYRLKGAYVATLSADNSALHLIVGQCNNRNRCLCAVISRAALNCCCNDFSRYCFGFVFGLLFILHDLNCFFVSQIFFKCRKQIIFCLFFGEARNSFKHIKLTALEWVNLCLFALCAFDLLCQGFFSCSFIS